MVTIRIATTTMTNKIKEDVENNKILSLLPVGSTNQQKQKQKTRNQSTLSSPNVSNNQKKKQTDT